ncbi:MAG TPA: amino acid ABC transporter permease [Micromonosporaceae bacterium]|nr:amino acid ABC transporter permease [Micromonosporaceae bacterium]
MTAPTSERARPEAIKAVPVRRPWRWVASVVVLVLVAMFLHMIFTNDHFEWKFIFVSSGEGQRGAMFTPPVLAGLRGTIYLTILAMLIAVVLGVILAIMRLSPGPILKGAAFVYIWFFRAVPLIVLAVLFGNVGILWHRFGLGLPFDQQIGNLFGVHDLSAKFYSHSAIDLLSGFIAGMLALALSEAAYMAEIVRAGILSVDPGQTEAAAALGLSRRQTLRRIVLPQAMRVIVPPTGNETIAMVKNTSLVAYVPVSTELFFQLQAIGHRTFQVFPVLVAAVIWYLIICTILMIAQYYVERYFSRGYGQSGRGRLHLRDIAVESTGRISVKPADDTGSGGNT